METPIAEIAIPYRVYQSYHYLCSETDLTPGSLVEVEFGTKKTIGFFLGFAEKSEWAPEKLKKVRDVLIREPLFDPTMLRFLKWVSDYYCHPYGEVLSTAIPRDYWKGKLKQKLPKPPSLPEIVAGTPPTLTAEQTKALEQIENTPVTQPILLHGVTGSGKTEIYIRLIEKTLAEGKGAMILVPEIALTPQLSGRFAERFHHKVSILHSGLTPRERFWHWQQIVSGERPVVLGVRSAVFAPVPNLGLIIVDEEHEPSFKQEDNLRYHARDLAVMRGHFWNARVVLGSATPSVESYANARRKKYGYVRLAERVQSRPLPEVRIVNVRDKESCFQGVPWLSHVLYQQMAETLAAGEQTLLYLNRLGFAHFLYCNDCGHTWSCRQCDISLTYYTSPPLLKCHYCGSHQRPPSKCPQCMGIKLEAMGVGTERVARVMEKIFPTARIERMDRSVIQGKKSLEELLAAVHAGEVDILVGTQMIAKGHDFPGVTLVGVLMADASLHVPDFRANERTYQILTQVSGRAGRAQKPGRVVLQTIHPDNPIILSSLNPDPNEFYGKELALRELHHFPPYGRIAMLRFQHRQSLRAEGLAREMIQYIHSQGKTVGIEILGPTEAPVARVKGLYRWQFLLKAGTVKQMQDLLHSTKGFLQAKKSPVQWFIDVDPLHMG